MQVTEVKESKLLGPGGQYRRKLQLMDLADKTTVSPFCYARTRSAIRDSEHCACPQNIMGTVSEDPKALRSQRNPQTAEAF